jgi:hypothetical protein
LKAMAFFVDLGGSVHWDYRYHLYLEHTRPCTGVLLGYTLYLRNCSCALV